MIAAIAAYVVAVIALFVGIDPAIAAYFHFAYFVEEVVAVDALAAGKASGRSSIE